MSAHLDGLVTYFEQLTEASVPRLRELYAADAYFKDPFNEVHGVEQIERIFAHMFGPLAEPRFVVNQRIEQGNEAFLTWDFRFRIRRYKPEVEQTIRGGSHLRFNEHGKLCYHRDYWDAAEELYEKLPVIGAVMRALKRRMS